MAATKGSPWMGPSFTNGPGPSRALDPLPAAAFFARSKRVRPAVGGRSSKGSRSRGVLNDVGKAVFGHQVRCVAPICANFYNYLFTERAFRAIISVYGPLF